MYSFPDTWYETQVSQSLMSNQINAWRCNILQECQSTARRAHWISQHMSPTYLANLVKKLIGFEGMKSQTKTNPVIYYFYHIIPQLRSLNSLKTLAKINLGASYTS